MKFFLTWITVATLITPGTSFSKEAPPSEARSQGGYEIETVSAPSPAASPAAVTTQNFGREDRVNTSEKTEQSELTPRPTPTSGPTSFESDVSKFAASNPASSPTAPLDCDDTCANVDAVKSGELNFCGDNATCKSCVTDNLAKSQTGQYCEARGKYEKARKIQNLDMALYLAGASFCFAACANPEMFTKIPMEAMCQVGTIGLAVKNLATAKHMTEVDKETAGWLKTANKFSSMSMTAAGTLFALELAGVKAVKTAVAKVMTPQGASCVTGALLLATAGFKKANVPNYNENKRKLCEQIKDSTKTLASTANSCRTESGMGALTNAALGFKKPQPFPFTPDQMESSAITDGGLVGELYKDKTALTEAYNMLKPEIKSRLENGEDPFEVASSSNMLPSGANDEAQKLVAKLQDGSNSFLGGVSGIAQVQGGAGKAASTAGGVNFDSFGASNVASSEMGEGVNMDAFSASSGSAGAHSSACGQGPLHEGCKQSIFHIVSNQLVRKSKDESIAKLTPVLPLNQMRAGIKVDTKDNQNPKRSPANNPLKVK